MPKRALILPTLLFVLCLLCGAARAEQPLTGVIVLVHGVSSGPATYARFKERIWAQELPGTALIELNWGHTGSFHASGSIGERANFVIGMNNTAWDAVAKLKDVVAQCREIVGPRVPITILCHSQGTVITAAALQEGLRVDHVVMIGSCLGYESVRTGARNTHLGRAARNVSGTLLNCWSPDDETVQAYKGGIGGLGLPKTIKNYTSGNLRDIRVDDVQHTGDEGWWAMRWLQRDDPGAWHGGTRTELLALLRGTAQATWPPALAALQDFARTDTSAGWYGEADRNATGYTFTLPQGLVNGIHFGDKEACRATITCTQGTVRCRIRAAQWTSFNEGTAWRTVRAGETVTLTYRVRRSPKDAMVWLQVEGRSDTTARAACHFEAWD